MGSLNSLEYKIIIAASFSLLISSISVTLRLISRRVKRAPFLCDDYFSIAGLIFITALAVASLLLIGVGLGEQVDHVSLENLRTFHQLSYTVSLLYVPTTALPKLSILFFYRRILPVKQIFQSTTVLSSLLAIWCIAMLCTTLFQCFSMYQAWSPVVNGHCISPEPYILALQIPNILLDFAIILLPLKFVWDCALKFSAKLTASAFFMAGILTLTGDFVKLAVMLQTDLTADVTYSQVDNIVWTNLGPALAMAASSIPVLRPLLQSPKWFSSKRSSGATSLVPPDPERCDLVEIVEPQPLQVIQNDAAVMPSIPPEAHINDRHTTADFRTEGVRGPTTSSKHSSFLHL